MSYRVYRSTTDYFPLATLLADGLPTTYYEDTTAEPGTLYYYWFQEELAGVYGEVSDSVQGGTAPAAPAAPGGITASGQPGYNALSWTLPSDAPCVTILRATTDDIGLASVLAEFIAGDSYQDTTAEVGTPYYYWLRALSRQGEGASSASVTATALILPPATPILSASTGIGQIELTWAAAERADSYSLWRSTTDESGTATLVQDGLTGLSYDDASVDYHTTYYYWLKAHNTSGDSAYSATASAAADYPVPEASANVQATAGLAGKITVSWDAATYADSYSVWRSTTNDFNAATELATGIATTTFDDDTVDYGATYYYWVTATGESGTSTPSSGASGYANDPIPTAPANVLASDDQPGQVTVSWDAATYADSYSVWRSYYSDPNTASQIASGITGTEYVDEGAPYEATQYYWVKATGESGTSDFGDPDTGYALEPIPAAPGISATTSLVGHVEVSLTAPQYWDYYAIYRGTDSDFANATLLDGNYTGNLYDDTTAVPSTTYWYFATAINGSGESSASSTTGQCT